MLAHDHLMSVARQLTRLVRAGSGAALVLAGEQEHTSALTGMLAPDVRAAVAGTVRAEAHVAARGLLPLVLPLLQQRTRDQDHALASRWRHGLGRRERAVQGWADTLAAASSGEVDLLLYADAAAGAARRCPGCGQVSIGGTTCRLDGARLQLEPDALDLAVRLTLVHGGTARRLHDGAGFDAVDGVGALLRFNP
jgi:hypothetical protein